MQSPESDLGQIQLSLFSYKNKLKYYLKKKKNPLTHTVEQAIFYKIKINK